MKESRPKPAHSQRGYIALMSALLLSTILVVLTFAANTNVFIARDDLSNAEDYLQAKHYAHSCGDIALRILNQNPIRVASSSMVITLNAGAQCTVIHGSASGNLAEAEIYAAYRRTVSVLHIRASRASSTTPFLPTYWSE